MKTNKLLAAGALALSMAMTPVASLLNAMPMSVLAAENDTHTITITNVPGTQSYDAYQVFSGDISANVLRNIEWGSGVNRTTLLDKLNLAETTTAREVAEKLDKNEISSDDFAKAVAESLTSVKVTSEAGTTEGTAVIKGLQDGYYFVKDSSAEAAQPTRFMLRVVEDDTVAAKIAGIPTHEKKVDENTKSVTTNPTVIPQNADKTINDVADYNIGDNVPFTIAATVPNTSSYDKYEFTFNDVMDAGLTLNADSIKVYQIVGDEKTVVDSSRVTIKTGEQAPRDKTFAVDVVIKNKTAGANVDTIAEGAKILIEFTATLNENAVVATPENKVGNENKFTLQYTNNPNTFDKKESDEDKVVVFTYALDINKVDGDKAADAADRNLVAKFKLKLKDGGYVKVNDDGVVISTTATVDEASVLTTTNGIFTVKGLDDGEYELFETEAPAGYNKIDSAIAVTLSGNTENGQTYDKQNTKDSTALSEMTVKLGTATPVVGNDVVIENKKGSSLPETGGMGTTMIYGVGAVMVAGAAVFYVTNKRTRKD